jgi:hypothetical protein
MNYIGYDHIYPDKTDKPDKNEEEKRRFAVDLFTPVTGSLDDFDIGVYGVGRFLGETFGVVNFIQGAINPCILFLYKEPFMLTAIRESHTSSIFLAKFPNIPTLTLNDRSYPIASRRSTGRFLRTDHTLFQ